MSLISNKYTTTLWSVSQDCRRRILALHKYIPISLLQTLFSLSLSISLESRNSLNTAVTHFLSSQPLDGKTTTSIHTHDFSVNCFQLVMTALYQRNRVRRDSFTDTSSYWCWLEGVEDWQAIKMSCRIGFPCTNCSPNCTNSSSPLSACAQLRYKRKHHTHHSQSLVSLVTLPPHDIPMIQGSQIAYSSLQIVQASPNFVYVSWRKTTYILRNEGLKFCRCLHVNKIQTKEPSTSWHNKVKG